MLPFPTVHDDRRVRAAETPAAGEVDGGARAGRRVDAASGPGARCSDASASGERTAGACRPTPEADRHRLHGRGSRTSGDASERAPVVGEAVT